MSDSQNKTENATPKRKSEARKKGQVPRSKETVSFALLFVVSCGFLTLGGTLYNHFKKILGDAFLLTPYEIHHTNLLLYKAKWLIMTTFLIFTPIFIAATLAIYFGTIALGGNVFSTQKIIPKLSNISPKNAFKRIFSMQSVTTLLQAILKCTISTVILVGIIKGIYPRLVDLSYFPLNTAMQEGAHYIISAFVMLSLSTFIYCLIDYPYQIYKDSKSLKMSKQEVKDEYKNSEGNPEIKRRVRTLQRRVSRKRNALRNLEKADIVITNPTHYAVALQYDENTMDAPVIVSLGANMLALHIRRKSAEYKIPILEIPLLARALYHYGEIGQVIPEPLFYAVARVIAYIYGLDDPLSFHLERDWVDQLPIPEELTEPQTKI